VLVELYELTLEEPEIRLMRARNLARRVLAGGRAMSSTALDFLRAVRTNGDERG
jgi:hypothetical protein